MDALTRRKRMQGYEVLWLPGMDHAGIATQTVVEKQLAVDGKTKEDFGRELFIDKVWDWKRESGGTIGGQMRRLGDGVDWSRDRFTMDDGLSRAVRTIFKRLFDAGLIYQAERLVNWSPVLQTAISRPRGQVRGRRGRAGVVPVRLDGRRTNRTSWWPPPGSRRCSATPRSRCTPTTSATGHLVGTTLPHPFLDRDIDHRRRRARRPRIRYGRSQGHPRPRSERLRDRSAARPADAVDHGHQGPDRRHRNAIRRHGPLRGAGRGPRGAGRRGPHRRGEAALPAQRRALRTQRRAHRAAAVAAVVGEGRIAGQGRRRCGSQRRHRDSPDEPGAALVRLGRQHARLVHLAAAVVGPPHPDLARPERREGLRRAGRNPAGGLGAGPRRARHLVLGGAVAVLHDGLAGAHRRTREVLSHQRFGHRLRHPVLLGGPDDDVRHLRRRRSRDHRWRAARAAGAVHRTSSCTA